MDKENVLQCLHQHQATLDAFEVDSLMLFGLVSRSEAKKSSDVDFVGKRSDLTSLLPEAVAAIQAQKLVKSLEELNGYLCRCLQVTAYI